MGNEGPGSKSQIPTGNLMKTPSCGKVGKGLKNIEKRGAITL